MTVLHYVPYLAIFVAVLLPYWPRHIVTGEMAKLPGGYDNKTPRVQQARLEGYGRRALSAHQNGLEALPMFGIVVLAAMQRSVDVRVVSALCVLFVAVRIMHVLAYLHDRGRQRGVLFLIGWGVCLLLILLAAFAGR